MKSISLKNIIFYSGLLFLFLLQETEKYNAFILLTLTGLFALVIFSKKHLKIQLPVYFVFSFLIYLIFMIEGLLNGHHNPTIDIKFQFFIFLLFLIFLNYQKADYITFFFWVNVVVFIVYILLYFKMIPSYWNDFTFGYRGKLFGPALISFIFIAFDYLYRNKPVDKTLIIAFILSLGYILLSANFMNLIIISGLMFLILVDLKKLFSPKIMAIIGIIILLFVAFVNSKYVPVLVQNKLQYVSKPWEYPSFKIRINDFKSAVKNEDYQWNEVLTGKGFGASTSIYRENKIVQAFSRTFTFQEIDNGFYYIFHRGGLILLLLFIGINTIILLMLPNLKSRLAFFMIITVTNLLSIHFFNYYFFVFLYFYIFTSPYSKKLTFKYPSKQL